MTAEELFFKLNKIHRILIVVAICVLLLVAFYFLIVSGQMAQIKSFEKKISRVKNEIQNEEKNLKQGPVLKARITKQKEKLQSMVASLPMKQDIEALLKKITELLSETNLVSKKFVPGQEQINRELYYAAIPIELNVRGDYEKQGAFLASLNDLPRIVNVPRIALGPASGLNTHEQDLARKLDVIVLDAEISGVTYRRLTPDEIERISKSEPKGKKRKRSSSRKKK